MLNDAPFPDSRSSKGMKPYTQKSYYGTEGDNGKLGANKLTPEEKKMVDRVTELWNNYIASKK